jgi:hypothetical protein
MALAALASAGFAAPTHVLGTGVSMDPPAGFVASQRFPGFENDKKGASIVVTELPGPASKMQQGMTRDMLATRGMTLIRSQPVKIGGTDALLIQVSQSADGTDFLKWMLVAGDARKTVMIVGTFPKAAADMSPPIKRAVLSASWGGEVKAQPYEGLPFRVDPTLALKLAGRVGNVLVFSESGSMGQGDAAQAILVVGSSISAVSITNVEQFAKDHASKTTQVSALRNIQGKALTLDGLPAYELVAEADDLKTMREVRMYQLVLADKTTYYLAQGFVSAGRGPAVMDRFREVARSFRRVRPPK